MNNVIIVASGVGERMGMELPKQYLELKNVCILLRTINVFEQNHNIAQIIVVIMKEHEKLFNEKVKINLSKNSKVKVVFGGKERYESVYNGLIECGEGTEVVLIHDGVRPFVTQNEINVSIEEALKKQAVILGCPVTDTIKVVNNETIVDTPNRSNLFNALTPQTYKYSLIKDSYECFMRDKNKKNVTDDAMVVERFGQEVYIVLGSKENIKITTPFDLVIGEAILNARGEN